MRDGEPGAMTDSFLPEDAETADALRLADVLERVEAGRAPDLDPTEDPALTDLLLTAMRARAELGTVGDERSFQSFRGRSRAAILHSLERPAKVVPFYRRSRILAPIAAAAAAAAIVLSAFSSGILPGRGASGTSGNVATNLTPRTTTEELDRLSSAIADIQERQQSGQSVPAPLLRAVSEGTARVANIIEQSPERVSKETVASYIQTAQTSQTVLKSLTVDDDAQGALAAAQRASRDGVVVASRFLNASGTPTATATATGTPTPTATGTPTATPTGSPTPTATGTPAPSTTPSATPTPGATPDPGSDIVR